MRRQVRDPLLIAIDSELVDVDRGEGQFDQMQTAADSVFAGAQSQTRFNHYVDKAYTLTIGHYRGLPGGKAILDRLQRDYRDYLWRVHAPIDQRASADLEVASTLLASGHAQQCADSMRRLLYRPESNNDWLSQMRRSPRFARLTQTLPGLRRFLPPAEARIPGTLELHAQLLLLRALCILPAAQQPAVQAEKDALTRDVKAASLDPGTADDDKALINGVLQSLRLD